MSLTPQTNKKLEYRITPVGELSIREEGKERRVSGSVIKYNQLSVDLGGFRERMLPGAFRDSIAQGDIMGLWAHQRHLPIASTSNGTLVLRESDEGVDFEMFLDDDAWSEFAWKKISRRDVKGMSFAFGVPPRGDKWSNDKDLGLIREVMVADVAEVSPVVFPAYPQTTVDARSLDQVREALNGGKQVPLSVRYRELEMLDRIMTCNKTAKQ